MYLLKGQTITTKPTDWPQGFFKEKSCRNCGLVYKPQSPCHLYCSEVCSTDGRTTRYLERNYGISIQDYRKMLEEQNHLCAICHGEGFVMKESHSLKLVVDHCHSGGQVRGLLCHNCNRALGLLKDNVEVLQRAKDYLEGSTTIPKGSTHKCGEAPSPKFQCLGDDIV